MSKTLVLMCADGTTKRAPLELGRRLTVGKSSTADVRLEHLDELEDVHLLVVPERKDCWVACSREAATSALVAGKLFQNGRLTWGSEIDIGSLTVRLENTGASAQVSRMRLILAAGFLLVAATQLMGGVNREQLPSTSAAPPALLAEAERACPDEDRARDLADELIERGNAERNRYNFDARDGTRAERHYAEAIGCLETLGAKSEHVRIQGTHAKLRRQLSDDYALHRLRLRNALKRDESEAAVVEIAWLLRLLDSHRGDYTSWLERLERHLTIRIEKKKRKK